MPQLLACLAATTTLLLLHQDDAQARKKKRRLDSLDYVNIALKATEGRDLNRNPADRIVFVTRRGRAFVGKQGAIELGSLYPYVPRGRDVWVSPRDNGERAVTLRPFDGKTGRSGDQTTTVDYVRLPNGKIKFVGAVTMLKSRGVNATRFISTRTRPRTIVQAFVETGRAHPHVPVSVKGPVIKLPYWKTGIKNVIRLPRSPSSPGRRMGMREIVRRVRQNQAKHEARQTRRLRPNR
jgi:hypothetical protein